MWEPDTVRGYKRRIQSFAKQVTDPEDLNVIFELEKEMMRVKADAVRTLQAAGYSQRDIARATGRSRNAVVQWTKQYPPVETQEPSEEESDGVPEDHED
jgi:hypothetical protein